MNLDDKQSPTNEFKERRGASVPVSYAVANWYWNRDHFFLNTAAVLALIVVSGLIAGYMLGHEEIRAAIAAVCKNVQG